MDQTRGLSQKGKNYQWDPITRMIFELKTIKTKTELNKTKPNETKQNKTRLKKGAYL